MLLLELLKVANFAGQQNMELLNRLHQIGQPINAQQQLNQTTASSPQASSLNRQSNNQIESFVGPTTRTTDPLDSFKPLDLSMNKNQVAIVTEQQNNSPQERQVARQRFTRYSNRPPPIALDLVTKRDKSIQQASKLTSISSSTSPSSAHSAATSYSSSSSICPSLKSPNSDTISSTNGCRRIQTNRANGRQKRTKSHICNECGRSFSRSDMLTRHWRLHSGLKPYQCSECLQVFSRSDHLATHERTHTGEKPYQCEFCQYSACRRDMITRHMRTHKGTKARKCKQKRISNDRKGLDEKVILLNDGNLNGSRIGTNDKTADGLL